MSGGGGGNSAQGKEVLGGSFGRPLGSNNKMSDKPGAEGEPGGSQGGLAADSFGGKLKTKDGEAPRDHREAGGFWSDPSDGGGGFMDDAAGGVSTTPVAGGRGKPIKKRGVR